MFDELSSDFPDAENITIDEVSFIQDPIFIDVREQEEMDISMIKEALSQAEFENDSLALKERNLIIYCTIGYRSGLVAQELKLEGYKAYNLIGGVLIWSHQNLSFYQDQNETKNVHVYAPEWNLLNSRYNSIF